MSTGNWNEKNRPKIPGFYNRFKTKAEERVGTGIHGILGMPVRSDWGPINEVVSINHEKELKKLIGDNFNLPGYKLGRLALLGNPKELLLYRIADDSAKKSSLKLKNSEQNSQDIILLETKYPTDRKFNVTIKTNLVESSKKDFIFYEGTKILFTSNALSGSIDEIIEKINSNVDNSYITAKKIDNSNGTLSNTANEPFTDGNNGINGITNEHYLKAMSVLEGYNIDGFALDGVTDSSLQAAVKEWTLKNKDEGVNIIAFLGGPDDEKLEQANSKSREFNNDTIVNVFIHGIYEGVVYKQSEVAVYIAALATGKSLKESICNEITIFDDVQPRLGKTEIKAALNSGTLVLAKDADDVIVVDDVNTFKNYPDDKSAVFGSIRAVKFLNAVDGDTSLKRKDFVGKVVNDDNGKAIIICALKKYFEILDEENVIEKDFTVEVDKELQSNASSDEFFWKWSAKYVDVIKRIYGTGYVRQ